MRRTVLAALAASGALLSVGQAAEIAQPVWLQAPDRNDWAKAYPAEAAKAGLEGRVRLSCVASSVGKLEHCTTLEEAPAGHGFADAAMTLTAGMQLAATLQNGQPSAGKAVLVPVRFTPDLMRPSVIIDPDWLKKPRGEDLGRWWPAAAAGSSGKALIGCVVTNRGLLDKCRVLSESPAGKGFGGSALLMAPSFLMRPMTVDGRPVGGGEVRIPINWVGGPGVGGGEQIRLVQTLPWAKTPTAEEMAAAYPKNAIGRFVSGHVVLHCHVVDDGVLKSCETVTAEPSGQGFAQAAMTLSHQFKALINPQVLKQVKDLYINLPFDFRDPSRPAAPVEVVDPQWLTKVSPQYPKAAADAGVKTGRGTVLCQVSHDGALNQCSVVGEEPPGLGFGDAALTVAQVMVMNPWTQQGAPVDGAHVRLPIRLNLGDDAPAPPAPAPAKP